MAFEVAWLDPGSMALSTIVAFDDDQALVAGFGGATGALLVGDRIWVGSFTGDRIAVFPSDPN